MISKTCRFISPTSVNACRALMQTWMAAHFTHRPGSGCAHTLLTSAVSHRNIWSLLVRPSLTHKYVVRGPRIPAPMQGKVRFPLQTVDAQMGEALPAAACRYCTACAGRFSPTMMLFLGAIILLRDMLVAYMYASYVRHV